MNHLATEWTLNTTLCPLCLVGEPEILAENWPRLFTKFSNWLLNYSVLSTFFPFPSPHPPLPSPPLPSPPPSPLLPPPLSSPSFPSLISGSHSLKKARDPLKKASNLNPATDSAAGARKVRNLNRDFHAVHFD